LGAVGISHKHALALINRGDAMASDIVDLKDEIQHGVQKAWGILLEPEPVFIGF
jgi:UDP-N-acetylmuramate dehydrogenase